MFDWMRFTTDVPETGQAIEAFLTKRDIPLVTKVSQHGEVLDYGARSAKYNGMDLVLNANGIIRISFSPHILYNELLGEVNRVGKAMNHDLFTPNKLNYVFDWLNTNLAIRPEQCYIRQLEIGVNLTDLGIDTNTILDSVISYKGKRSSEMRMVGAGRGEEFVFGNYCRVKIYNKALQNGLPESILRFEYKAKKVQPLVPILGKHPTLSDLLNQHNWLRCEKKLLETAKLCVFNDEFNTDLTARQKAKLSHWQNPKFWVGMQPDTRCKQKNAFERLIQQHGTLQIGQAIKTGIQDEVRRMLSGAE